MHRRFAMVAEPWAGVRSNGEDWESTGVDPIFLLRTTTGNWPCGWVEICLTLRAEDGLPARPRLYYDGGSGFKEITLAERGADDMPLLPNLCLSLHLAKDCDTAQPPAHVPCPGSTATLLAARSHAESMPHPRREMERLFCGGS